MKIAEEHSSSSRHTTRTSKVVPHGVGVSMPRLVLRSRPQFFTGFPVLTEEKKNRQTSGRTRWDKAGRRQRNGRATEKRDSIRVELTAVVTRKHRDTRVSCPWWRSDCYRPSRTAPDVYVDRGETKRYSGGRGGGATIQEKSLSGLQWHISLNPL